MMPPMMPSMLLGLGLPTNLLVLGLTLPTVLLRVLSK
jgi:hypothetical protein